MFLKSLFIEKLISTVYLANSQSGQTDTLDSLPVLTSLNKLNGTSLNHLAKLIISTNNSNNKVDKDLLYKIITGQVKEVEDTREYDDENKKSKKEK